MLKKYLLIVSVILICFSGTAQKSINNYKYIIIPKEFSFSKSEDQYQLNSLTKFLFNKYGYEAYFSGDDLPQDLSENRCLALTAEASNEKGGLFKTKIEFVLKDCFGVIVMTSKVGESRLKEFDKAYNQAIRQAFETFQEFDYVYTPALTTKIESLKEEIKVKETKENSETVVKDLSKKEEITSEVKKDIKTENKVVTTKTNELYYAQKINNGYQLVNSEPKIVMVLLSTAAENVYLVKGKSAIVFKEDGFWYYSENDGTLDQKKKMNIKF